MTATKTWLKRAEAFVLANTKPASVNKGKAGKEGLTVIW
jgi:hypothetical protein